MEPEPALECLCNKALYVSKKHAETVRNEHLKGVYLNGGERGRQRRGRPEVLRVYECPDGAGWHLSAKRTWR